MTISIELNGLLTIKRERRQMLEFHPGMTAGDAAASLGLDAEEIGLVTINGVQSELEDLLKPECRLCFFSYITGG